MRRCSHCGQNGHNSRTCPERCIKLFGVRLPDVKMRKSVSTGNLSSYSTVSTAQGTPDHSDTANASQDGFNSDGSAQDEKNARERKKGVPWTEEEHRMFLLGLQKLGKGDWRGISRNYVQTRTPTQVASHAQKYFIRQSNLNKRKRRSSLFDMGSDADTSGMGRSMSTPSLASLAEEGPEPFVDPSTSGSARIAMFPPHPVYGMDRSSSYPTLPVTATSDSAGISTIYPSPPDLHRLSLYKYSYANMGSSNSLESLAEMVPGPLQNSGADKTKGMASPPSWPAGLRDGAASGMGLGMGAGLTLGPRGMVRASSTSSLKLEASPFATADVGNGILARDNTVMPPGPSERVPEQQRGAADRDLVDSGREGFRNYAGLVMSNGSDVPEWSASHRLWTGGGSMQDPAMAAGKWQGSSQQWSAYRHQMGYAAYHTPGYSSQFSQYTPWNPYFPHPYPMPPGGALYGQPPIPEHSGLHFPRVPFAGHHPAHQKLYRPTAVLPTVSPSRGAGFGVLEDGRREVTDETKGCESETSMAAGKSSALTLKLLESPSLRQSAFQRSTLVNEDCESSPRSSDADSSPVTVT